MLLYMTISHRLFSFYYFPLWVGYVEREKAKMVEMKSKKYPYINNGLTNAKLKDLEE